MESHTEEVHGVMNCCQGNATQDKKQNLATNTHSPLHVPHPITDPPSAHKHPLLRTSVVSSSFCLTFHSSSAQPCIFRFESLTLRI